MTDRITLTLYGPDDEPIRTLSRTGIRWNMLKRITHLDDMMKECDSEAERLEVIIDTVALLFEGAATIEEIESGCNFDECLAVFGQIMGMVQKQKASNFQPAAKRPLPNMTTRK